MIKKFDYVQKISNMLKKILSMYSVKKTFEVADGIGIRLVYKIII